MPFKEATVDAVVVKELSTPDQYKNTHRRSIKIGEDWYSCGSGKSDKFNAKTSQGDWHTLSKGDKVEFKFNLNGDYKNVDMKTFSVVAVNPSPQQQSSKPSASSAPANKDFVNPATVGACLNLAVEVLGYKEKDFEDVDKLKYAIQWHKSTFERMEKLYPKVEIKPNSESKSHKADDAVPFGEDDSVDEI
jgi:hypothetical protein